MIFRWIRIVFILLVMPVPVQASTAFLISGETVGSSRTDPDLTIYQYSPQSRQLKEERKFYFPSKGYDGGIHQVSMMNKQKVLAVVGTGETPLIICNISNILSCEQHHFGGYNYGNYSDFFLYKGDSLALRSLEPHGWLQIAIDFDSFNQKISPSIDRDKIMPTGNSMQAKSGTGIGLYIDSQGALRHLWGRPGQKTKFQIDRVDDETLENIGNDFSVVLNSEKYLTMVTQSIKGENKNEYAIITLDKFSGDLTRIWEPKLAYALPIEPWIVWQELEKQSNINRYLVTGTFRFHHLPDNKVFKSFLGKDSEVFDIDDEGWVLYRAGDTLYRAQIQKDHLSDPIKLVTDPAILGVHWGLWAEDEESEKVIQAVAPTTKTDQREFSYLYLIIGIGLLLVIGLIVYLKRRKNVSDGDEAA